MSGRGELHPDSARVLAMVRTAGLPPYHRMSAAEARAEHERRAPALDLDPVALPRVENFALPGPAGPLPARLYATRRHATADPLVLFLHGGGHTLGSIDSYDRVCRRLCAAVDAPLVSLGYRLAPEHRFPAAVEDAYAALAWLSEHAGELGCDPRRIAVAGDSAGGNLAAVLCLLAREHGLAMPRHQLLVYPAVAADLDHPSHARFGNDHLLTRESIDWFQDNYLGDASLRRDWRFAPLLASDHSGLAPATVMVASHDPLRDEGIAYARRLRRAGTPTRLVIARGMLHAFWNLGGAIGPASGYIDLAGARLREALR